MKKTNTIPIILGILVWSIFFCSTARAQINIDSMTVVNEFTTELDDRVYNSDVVWQFSFEIDQRKIEFNAVAPALLLMELYMHDLRTYNDSIIGNSSRIMPNIKQPHFADFYDWTQRYFKEQLK